MAPVNNTRPAILAALTNGDMTLAELCEELEAVESTVQYNLRHLLESGQIHICGWGLPRRQGLRHPIYRLGEGRNRSMGRQTLKERNARQFRSKRRRIMLDSMAEQRGNPFASLIAQVAR